MTTNAERVARVVKAEENELRERLSSAQDRVDVLLIDALGSSSVSMEIAEAVADAFAVANEIVEYEMGR